MIKLTFIEPSTKQWKRWVTDARKETDELVKLVKARRAYAIKGLYKRRKDDIFGVFFDKCAFCESKISKSQPGDVEHFRPKGGLKDEDGQTVYLKKPDGTLALGRGRKPKPHPGYYWLAYDWQNLLPSCSKCNRSNKGTLFPVKGFRACAPGDERREKPLLLNPLLDDPQKHFVLDIERGVLGGRTREGRACIKILDLNREGLLEARRKTYQGLVRAIKLSNYELSDPGITKAALVLAVAALIRDVLDSLVGRTEYAFAARIAIEDNRELMEPFEDLLAEELREAAAPPPQPPAPARKSAKKPGLTRGSARTSPSPAAQSAGGRAPANRPANHTRA